MIESAKCPAITGLRRKWEFLKLDHFRTDTEKLRLEIPTLGRTAMTVESCMDIEECTEQAKI